MKKLEAIIRPMKLEAVKAALAEEAGVTGMTISDIRGFSGRSEGMALPLLSAKGAALLSPKIKIEMVLTDESVQAVIDVLRTYAQTGAEGDGKIFVMDMEDAVRIRTADRGDAAI